VPGRIEARLEDGELHLLVVIGDGRDLVEELSQSFAPKPVERFELDLDEIRHLQNGGNARIRSPADANVR
jgi:hypothetical protein